MSYVSSWWYKEAFFALGLLTLQNAKFHLTGRGENESLDLIDTAMLKIIAEWELWKGRTHAKES